MKRKIQLSKGYCINKKSIAKLLESHMAQLKGGIKEKKNPVKFSHVDIYKNFAMI